MRHPLLPLLAAIFCTLALCGCGEDDDDNPVNRASSSRNVNANPAIRPEYKRLEMPRVRNDNNNLVVVHSTPEYGVNYILEWDCQKKSQRWSCYTLDRKNSPKNVSRWYAGSGESQYPRDPDIPSAYTFAEDPYYRSGYDHGHICPSYDRLNSKEANIQTFYLSNMQPQRNLFNAGLWLKMENIVSSTWNLDKLRDTLYVCKGGTIDNPEQVLLTTNKGLLVPRYFYMAVLCKNSQGYKAIGFWVEHLNEDHSLDNLIDYVVSIDKLESLTGIDFFCNLPDDVEEEAEKMVYPSAWGLK
ncbi:MAG: DNA/RNA non-specific endonuclease [Prevotella sp.]|nr:DNA/RNA non-specific endonuclease [Prevotella sp.]